MTTTWADIQQRANEFMGKAQLAAIKQAGAPLDTTWRECVSVSKGGKAFFLYSPVHGWVSWNRTTTRWDWQTRKDGMAVR